MAFSTSAVMSSIAPFLACIASLVNGYREPSSAGRVLKSMLELSRSPLQIHACGRQMEEMLNETLKMKSERVRLHLASHPPSSVPGMDPSLHYLAPHVPKIRWKELGDLISQREKSPPEAIDGEHWVSLRLDGSGFNAKVRNMRRNSILEKEGFSEVFASSMQSTLKALMSQFYARLGYTHSDEMIVFIEPRKLMLSQPKHHPHVWEGRTAKLMSLAAGFATAHFIMQLAEHCLENNAGLEHLSYILPHFDCRVGHYDSWEEAQALLLWRAYDCDAIGVSDAVYHASGGGNQEQSLGRQWKVKWLWERGLLPLPRHQAYGTLFVRAKRKKVVKVQGRLTSIPRSEIEQRDGSVLELIGKDALFPADEELELHRDYFEEQIFGPTAGTESGKAVEG